ncbi:erythromycin biosynthesis sensory transduction protein eryC1 [Candidatus Roizmanbacteria bacterium RIFCSPLOWO2_01_FULL_37_13]|uniref:Erythromycin biosynthesis sensory transduction protein eryC1 n=1 Tax=Candidatus Roizmanbacteria bacterium RIFCSPHIGHO2_02_FULL_38_11 TaxID=1802039 RepID=A0A1F7H3J5_9BACT|nr:MAG: erythromycin biosynthesis sensory transduction protein eryC1 [Candidatus Roizmanbacteria bacterium RIFCSPHIGHO2_02_FULL_38_11]OGK43058.1 MAG: erythromycin biosynthesis sensory transduction protein eryC1 [Candidatus Roizmanbacteria bacterium RIFCSPLOWO2_01_FULL_37_13]
MKIPFLDLKKQYRTIKKVIDSVIQNVLIDGAFSGGPYVEKFEKNFAKYIGAKYAVGVNSGTSALHLAMIALGIKEGDEVVVPANTFIATAWAVSYVGAKPVFVDCKRDTWQIDPAKIEKRLNEKTKAIIGVHLFGQPFDIDQVLAIAKNHGLFLVEDCAQAHGAKYRRKTVGTFGDIACFSFYPSKNLGAYGEGGAVTTNNFEYAKRIKFLRNHASVKKYEHEEVGFNMRMDGIQAAILDVKLKYLNRWNRRRKEVARIYQTGIKNRLIIMQSQPILTESVYYVFVITAVRREEFMQHLKKHKIETKIHYPIPCHLQKAYRHLGYRKGDLPVAEDFSRNCVSIPLYPEMTNQEVKRICRIINEYGD